jgi:outer membrane biogenesis lipoprotein LolB
MNARVKILCLSVAAALLAACASLPVQPSSERPSATPARFDYERDDDLDDDLSRAGGLAPGARTA